MLFRAFLGGEYIVSLLKRLMGSSFTFPVAVFLFIVSGGISGCSDGSDNRPASSSDFLPITQPLVEEPPDVGEPFLSLASFDLKEVGYQKREFFLSGTANSFTNVNEFRSDGLWEIEQAEIAEYKTRIVVLRPIGSSDFSGTVLVEWLNVTAGFDRAPIWISGHTGTVREGHAWIGVSAQFVAVEGSGEDSPPSYLKAVNPERYGALMHPGDSFSYDIFSQASEAVRNPAGVNVLEGLTAKQIIAIGSTRSADRLVTYVNAIHPAYNPYDGYLISRRSGSSTSLAEPPQIPVEIPDLVTIRNDLNAPVLTLQSETELIIGGFVNDRQDDSVKFRLWEIPGVAHTDLYTLYGGLNDLGTDPIFAVMDENNLNCARPINTGPASWIMNAALDALVDWSLNNSEPASVERLAISNDGNFFLYDEHGNVQGGVRSPYVDAPAAILSGEGQSGPGVCYILGTTDLFDATSMASLYVDKAGYAQAVSDAADNAVTKGFLLPFDAERIKAAAYLQWEILEN
jgi:hypothetical protein